MRVCMYPQNITGEESGIARVIQAYRRYLPEYGVELVAQGDPCDLKAVHAGDVSCQPNEILVAHLHGLYWTADYHAPKFEYRTNQNVVDSMIHAREIIVPSAWVNEVLQRDMRRNARVIPHGIEWEDWTDEGDGGYVLWNKNRPQDVCSPQALNYLASKLPQQPFVSTFALPNAPSNVQAIGVVPHSQMKTLLQNCSVYLVTSKETFCIGALEAMAAGKPVLYYNYGNVPNLVPHGVAGYGAQPGNEEDLLSGLEYCLKYRKTLGANGRELVKQYTWAKACEQVATVYQQALEPEKQTVSVVIPCYNKAKTVGRAISSVVAQTKSCEIIVVDDGSTDDSWAEIQGYDLAIYAFKTENKGVAHARNVGLKEAHGKYIVFLDADDALEPTFVETLVTEIVKDRSLGAVYSKIRNVYPNGRTEISPWPQEWNYDQHLNGKNQIPTCCLLRREAVLALGGYRECYAQGKKCGFEDSDLFLRLGAYGWRAKLVTDEPLFLYSVGQGQITSSSKTEIAQLQRDEREYYRTYYPWYTSGQHPFASAATPKIMSHPVRQYDEPLVSVIICGEEDLPLTLNSLEAQTEHRWEAIAANTHTGYPYVRLEPRGPFRLYISAGDALDPAFIEQALNIYSRLGKGVVAVSGTHYALFTPLTPTDLCLMPDVLIANGRYMNTLPVQYEGSKLMGCPCHKREKVQPVVVKASMVAINDDDYIWVRYTGPGESLVGPVTQTNYGVKSTGDRFLCHFKDAVALRLEAEKVRLPIVDITSPSAPRKVKYENRKVD